MSSRRKETLLRLFRAGAGLLMVSALASCVTSHVLVGQARAPISPEQVRVYLRPPGQYEEIGLVESSSRASWTFTAQAKSNKVMDRLKKEAASLGANGIILQGVADQAAGSVGSGFANATASGSRTDVWGTGVSGTIWVKGGSAVAIYVPPEAASSR